MTVMHLAKFLRNKMDVPSKYKVNAWAISDTALSAITELESWACRVL